MMIRHSFLTFSCLTAFCASTIAWGEDIKQTAEVTAPATAPSDAAIAELIKQLDADDFKVRQQAAENLIAAGKSAVPALREAAQSTQLEVMSKALAILRGFHQGDNAELKTAAKEALEKVAAGSNSNAAQRAKDLLAPPKGAETENNPGNRIVVGQGQIILGGINGRIQINALPIQANGAKVNSKSISNVNGVKTTKVKQDGLEVEIIEAKEEITVKKTENGKTEEFKAKDAEELKKKHPAGHDLFEKYAGDKNNGAGGVMRLQFGGQAVPLPGQIQQAIPLQQLLPAVPAAQARPAMNETDRAITRLKSLERMIESAEQSLGRAATTDDIKDATKGVAEHLTKAKAELAKAKEKLSQKGENETEKASAVELKKKAAAAKAKIEENAERIKQESEKKLEELKRAADEALEEAKQ